MYTVFLFHSGDKDMVELPQKESNTSSEGSDIDSLIFHAASGGKIYN